jgi:hypothetical protein
VPQKNRFDSVLENLQEDSNWQWKGGSINGSSTASFRDLMPIPATFKPNPTLNKIQDTNKPYKIIKNETIKS